MFKKKVKEYNPYEGFPKYCKYDAKELIDRREITGSFFHEKTGVRINKIRYGRYCPDWKINRQLHTEYWEYWGIKEFEDGSPVSPYYGSE